MKARLQRLKFLKLDIGNEKEEKVPEIISTIRQAGKVARQEEMPTRVHDPESAFAKKFEVLFCGRVTVAHKKAPPALIDECIEKFNHISTQKEKGEAGAQQERTAGQLERSPSNNKLKSLFRSVGTEKSEDPNSLIQSGLRSIFFKTESQNGSSSSDNSTEKCRPSQGRRVSGHNHVQPTDIEENRTMLFTIGRSEIYLISPDTKKVAFEKNFKEISFCSQGIRHVDHFGFICRESTETRGCCFVCYVFQCTDEALVDEIMMTLKQAFSTAALQQSFKGQVQLCEGCPMQCLHKLCERIEGLNSSKTKLELQKHLAVLDNKEQTTVFEEIEKTRPKTEQEENELVISVLRHLYEDKQKDHIHNGEEKQVSQNATDNVPNETQSSVSRFRLDQLKSRAKRSLTESLESILSRGNKPRSQQESFESADSDSAFSSAVSSGISREPSVNESPAQHFPTVPQSPLKPHGSVGNLLKDLENDPFDSTQQGFRRRANTLSHVPRDLQQSTQPAEQSSAIPQRKLMRYHSVSTETPHQRPLALNKPNTEPQGSSGQPAASTPPAPLKISASSPNFLKYLKQNSAREQAGHGLQKSTSRRGGFRTRLPSSSSVPNFLKFLTPVDENSTSEFKKRTSHLALTSGAGSFDSPVRTRRHSWRQQIFLRVATPQKGRDSAVRHNGKETFSFQPFHSKHFSRAKERHCWEEKDKCVQNG
nr:PREDICTED: TBC1 domain family member 1-like isoform X1 [Latimeria chalumnae]|eukprot:XP_006011605.1 PREDICTED: TBC1 domain family member 1-like isoform X1 [Latimeria chalumnae]